MIVFYDDDCGFCKMAVQFLLKRDRKKMFLFAPLTGKTAEEKLAVWRKSHETVDSLVLIEGDEILYYSKACFRTLFYLGGIWKVIGIFSYLPTWMLFPSDLIYQIVARLRRKLCPLTRDEKDALHYGHEDRFLP